VTKDTYILVLNCGSSSLKFSLFRGDGFEVRLTGRIAPGQRGVEFVVVEAGGKLLVRRNVSAAPNRWATDALRFIDSWLLENCPQHRLIVGHRVVHGGAHFSEPVRITRAVLARLTKIIPLAPLHLPVNLRAIKAVLKWNPALVQVACFDTAFHQTRPLVSKLSAISWEFYESGVRRYGFHGLSYEHIASVLPTLSPKLARGRVVVAHLGNGASLCALKGGRSVESSMGFSVLDGIPMGTRPGRIDPGILIYLMRYRRMNCAALEKLLYRQSGLLGLSGVSSDMRQLLASDRPRARLAVDYFVYQVAREIAGHAAALEGLDGLIFTGGIGEHSQKVRLRIAKACAWLGVKIDVAANRTGQGRISTAKSPVSVWVVPANEELTIARHAWRFAPQ